MNLYSIFDSTTNQFGAPWTAVNDNQAKRSFERLVADKTTDIHFRPRDFSLHALGEFNEHSGALIEGLCEITPPLSS